MPKRGTEAEAAAPCGIGEASESKKAGVLRQHAEKLVKLTENSKSLSTFITLTNFTHSNTINNRG